jgi:hypothetical protein
MHKPSITPDMIPVLRITPFLGVKEQYRKYNSGYGLDRMWARHLHDGSNFAHNGPNALIRRQMTQAHHFRHTKTALHMENLQIVEIHDSVQRERLHLKFKGKHKCTVV